MNARNWKTTTAGLVSMVFSFIAFNADLFGGDGSILVRLSHFAVAGGFAAIGILAKDYNVTER